MKKFVITVLFTILFLCCPLFPALAAEQVQVTLPSFSITLNGQTMQNDYSKYPFIVYKDITYVPMTYYDSRLLGIKTDWSAENGLSITACEDTLAEYKREVLDTKNRRKQTASISDSRITVNGTVIDNRRETYPLLLFRNVTYFPLTWRFAVDEFGWQYQFDAEHGLVIENKNSYLQKADAWDGVVDEFSGIGSTRDTGEISLLFAPQPWAPVSLQKTWDCTYATDLVNYSMGVYNLTTADITLLPTDFSFEYQIYKVIGEQNELVYRRKVPFYTGELKAWHWASQTIPVSYWDAQSLRTGKYRVVLTHPDTIQYVLHNSQKTVTLDLREQPYPEIFEGYYVVFEGSHLAFE